MESSQNGSRQERYLRDLILDVARVCPNTINEDICREITLSEVLDSESNTSKLNGLSKDDILRFGLSSPRSELGPKAQQRLIEELDKTLLSITEFFHADVDWQNLSEEERNRLIWSLPESIASLKSSIESARSEVTSAYARLENLMNIISESHARLQADLISLVSKHPPKINSRRAASDELLAARIEASLIKLSLIRARATQTLYDHRSTKNPDVNVAQALSCVYARLRAEEKKMREEEVALDRQLGEYGTMLELVDGDGGGFKQVVEDWTRVQREKEECIRDLRRLGWTGD
ncbi:hypothetical protein J132_02219 [Termitomyces sp. J132]|nr:hypothetical protein J132_02219 [Termitomyces sp. J132]